MIGVLTGLPIEISLVIRGELLIDVLHDWLRSLLLSVIFDLSFESNEIFSLSDKSFESD
jgi:hypothetical protein